MGYPAVYQAWETFLRSFKWGRGEHISIIGPTGQGKSTIAFEIARKHKHTILFITSIEDPVARRYIERDNYQIERNWPVSPFGERFALWPVFQNSNSFAHQREVFRVAIDGKGKIKGIFQEGEWSVVFDEVVYMTDRLGLVDEMEMLWTQGRKRGISVIACAQRPFAVPQYMLNQVTHVFFFQVADKREVQRLSEIGGNISETIKDIVPHLKPHEFIYANIRTGDYVLSRVER